MDDDQTPDAAQETHTVDEVMQVMALLTKVTRPASDVNRILRSLKNCGSSSPQISEQLNQHLKKCLETFDVTEFEGKEPTARVPLAGENLARLATMAVPMGDELAKAQNVIAGQEPRSAEERSREEAFQRDCNGG